MLLGGSKEKSFFKTCQKKEGNRAQKEHGVWESSGIDQIKKIKEDIGLKKKKKKRRGHEECTESVLTILTSVDSSCV